LRICQTTVAPLSLYSCSMSSFLKSLCVEDGYRTPPDPVNLLDVEASSSDSRECEPLPPGVRLVLISDTHSRHEDMHPLPEGDVLIHAGDFTNTGHYNMLMLSCSLVCTPTRTVSLIYLLIQGPLPK